VSIEAQTSFRARRLNPAVSGLDYLLPYRLFGRSQAAVVAGIFPVFEGFYNAGAA